MNKKTRISTYHPLDFRLVFIDESEEPSIFREQVDRFFIHSFQKTKVNLRLPLPVHKKTVSDLMLITKGSTTRLSGIQKHVLRAGEFLLVAKETITSTIDMSDDLDGYYCHFADDFLEHAPFLLDMFLDPTFPLKLNLTAPEQVRLETLFHIMHELYQQPVGQPDRFKLIPFYLQTILAEIYQIGKRTNRDIVDKKTKLTQAFLHLARKHYMEAWPLTKYADKLSVTANHLNKTVKSNMQMTASQILNEIIVQEAKVLLLQTDLNISQIAGQLGYYDTAHFGKFFHRHTGSSPSSYRKMIDLY
ncbi:AraC family transcriptional regulator [Sphingobacterium sp. BN32]|uniref:AraC family transcriptional regulator n=1 Tax=Sphingobacterium sp. BN32 TaxID=3058432 RepID=UPI00265CE9A3|nr:helix-turn-helix domain-containing protein [Sphingobacterium sp. BN32]WKK59832.1 helix-turn-helix domain-containing protein [Sphingobacterium sp. BN32]